MSAISTFTFHESHNVRVQLIDGEPWFCLSDVCTVLTVDRSSDLIRSLDVKGVVKNLTPTNGGKQQLNYVNEPNLYRVIFRSNKPEAKQFQDWVFNEVLPTIRKTGKYEAPKPVTPCNYLTNNDMENIKRLVWHCSSFMDYEDGFSRSVWYALRAKTGVKSPEVFKVEDLPLLGEEFERIIQIIEPYLAARRESEKLLLSRLIRGRGDYEGVMKDILYSMRNSVEEQTENTRKKIRALFKHDLSALIERKAMVC